MANYDGTLKFDTKLDSSGFNTGLAKLGSVAKAGIVGIGTALAAAAGYAIKVGSDFEAGMSKVAAISGATRAELDQLSNKAKEMGASTKFSATEASDALSYMAMAGWKTEDMLDGLEGIMNLAAASGENLASTSDIVTDALTAFGMSAQDSNRFADVLAATSSNANTNVAMMGETFKYVAPVAGALGYSVEDTSLAIGLMANSGIKASQAGTTLRSILSNLSNPTDDVAGAMKDLGISLTDNEGNMYSLDEVIKQLRTGFSNLTESEKAQYAATIAGKLGMSGLLAIVNGSEADFNKLSDAIANSAGTAEHMAEVMQDNLQGQFTIMQSALEGLGIAIYEKFADPLKDAVKKVGNEFSTLTAQMQHGKLGKSMDTLAKGLADVAENALMLAIKSIPPLVDGLAYLIDHGQTVVTVLAGVGTALAVFKNWTAIMTACKTATALATAADLALGVAKSVLAGEITAAAGAQELMNLAVMGGINPIGLIVAAVAGLGVGLGVLAYQTGKANAIQLESTELIAQNAEEYENLKTSIEQSNEAYLSSLESAQVNAKQAEIMAQKVQELAEKENKSAGEKELLKQRIQELNDLVPGLNLAYDEETDSLNKSSDAIERNIQANRDLLIAEAMRNQTKEIINQMAEAEIGHAKAKETVKQAEEELQKAESKKQEILDRYNGSVEEAIKHEAANWNKAEAEWYKAQKNHEDAQTNVNKYYKQLKSLDKEYDEVSASAAKFEASAKWDQLLSDAEAAGMKIPAALSKAVEEAKKHGLEIPEKLAAGMRDNSIKPEKAAKQIQELINQATADSTKQYEQGQKQAGQEGFAGGINSKKGEAKQSGENIRKEADAGSSDTSGQKKNGEAGGSAYASGVDSKKGDAKTAGGVLRAEAYNGTSGGDFHGLGVNAAQGYINGLGSLIGPAKNVAKGLVDGVLQQMARTQKSRSPAKKTMQLGQYAGQGYALGLEKEEGTVTDTAKSLINKALDSMDGGGLVKLRAAASTISSRLRETFGGDSGLYQSAGVGARTVNYYSQLTINGETGSDPLKNAQQLQAMHRRMEWSAK